MSEQENIRILEEAYAAFGRGDIPAVLSTFADDIEWIKPGPQEIISSAGRRRGREQMAQFFAALAGSEEVESFEPQEFFASGDKVAVVGTYRGRVKSTGQRFESDWVQIFTFRGGRIVQMREFYDTAKAVELYGFSFSPTAHQSNG